MTTRDHEEQPIVIQPIPRPCRGCGVGEAEQHIDDCPAVIEAVEAAHNTPVSAPSGATQETPDATEAAQERVERYADVIRSHRVECFMGQWEKFGWHCLTCGEEREPYTRSLEVAEQDALSHNARAVIAVADQEQTEKDATIAELRAEVEEYRAKKFAPMSRIQRAERVAENAVADKRAAEARVAEKDATIADVLAKRNEDDVERWSGVLSEAEARVAELEATVARVREVHQPYQLFEPCPKTWGCEHDDCCEDPADGEYYHSDKPVSRACVECRDEDGQPVDWPCATAAVLDAPKDTTAP